MGEREMTGHGKRSFGQWLDLTSLCPRCGAFHHKYVRVCGKCGLLFTPVRRKLRAAGVYGSCQARALKIDLTPMNLRGKK